MYINDIGGTTPGPAISPPPPIAYRRALPQVDRVLRDPAFAFILFRPLDDLQPPRQSPAVRDYIGGSPYGLSVPF